MIIGSWRWGIYEEALANGFSSLGTKVFKLSCDCDEISFNVRQPFQHWRKINIINNDILSACVEKKPDMLFFYRGAFILPSTVKQLKNILPKTVICFYHNDNPYVYLKNRLKYFFFLQSLKHADITYVYRPSNLIDCLKFKAANPKLLLSHYRTDYHWWDGTFDLTHRVHDVVFIGHYENDCRAEYVRCIFNAGIDLHVFDKGWEKIFKRYNWPLTNCHDRLFKDKYRETINQAKIAIVFLSGKNQDVYTRRCFEIPACGTAMLLPDNQFLRNIFAADISAAYYNDTQSIIRSIRTLLASPEKLESITKNAYLIAQDHNEVARAKQITDDYNQLLG